MKGLDISSSMKIVNIIDAGSVATKSTVVLHRLDALHILTIR